MKKMLPAVALLSGFLFFASCDKADDDPYGKFSCTCFVTRNTYVYTESDTVLVPKFDTVYLNPPEMNKSTATKFCEDAKKGYADTLGSVATCKVK